MAKKEDDKFKPIDKLTFKIISISKSEDSKSLVYDLEFHNYKTEKEVIVSHVSGFILNILTKDFNNDDPTIIRKDLTFNIEPSHTVYHNLIRMMFLEMCYGAELLKNGESYKNSHIAFASTIYNTMKIFNFNILFHQDYDIKEMFDDIYSKYKNKYMIFDKNEETISLIKCYLPNEA